MLSLYSANEFLAGAVVRETIADDDEDGVLGVGTLAVDDELADVDAVDAVDADESLSTIN